MITIQNVTKEFHTKQGKIQVLRGIDLEVEKGEILVLLGASGSGKTTLLRCVAGLEKPNTGHISIGGRAVFSDSEKIFIQPSERGLGMVFQSYAIWPHMTVFENVALPLTQGRKKFTKSLVRDRVKEALRLVQLGGLEERPAPFLSGGQQQRVALARALAIKPQALLMDEPLSNLDARLREEVRSEIRELVKGIGVTVLYVTHDQVEAMALADRIAIMDKGFILQVGSPLDLYYHPVDASVAEFFGRLNWLEGRVIETGVLQTEIGRLHADAVGNIGTSVLIAVRPEDIELNASSSGNVNEFEGEILSTIFLGDYNLYQIQTQTGKKIQKKAMGGPLLNGEVHFRISKDKIRVFPKTE